MEYSVASEFDVNGDGFITEDHLPQDEESEE